jgi:tRNA(fMet)-specific endonuclease VapC
MSLYLMDTNIVSDIIKNPNGVIVEKIRAVGEKAIATSVIVAAELRFGAAKRGAPRLSARVEAILSAMTILPLDAPTDKHYAIVRASLEAQGRVIGGNDLWIAAHALATSHILVTNNVQEFERVAGLKYENWLQSG